MAELGKRRTLLKTKNIWSIEEAKAQFSELVSELERGNGYQTITKNGHPVAVIISKKDFERIHTKKNTLLEFFQVSPLAEIDLEVQRD